MFVKIDPDEHSQDAEDVYFDAEAKGQFDKDQIDGEWRADPRCEVSRKYALNSPLRSHDVEDFP